MRQPAGTTDHDSALRAPPHLLRRAARGLSPAYFALVMATGIVSVETELLALHRVAIALFALNVVAFVAIGALTALRVAWFPRELWRDMTDHQRAPGFFTSVAAAAVLGSQIVLLAADHEVAWLLWFIAVVLWIGLTYTVFAAFVIKGGKPSLDEGISGAWLLAVVATQSIAVLGLYLTAHREATYKPAIEFLALSMWLCGGMLYIWIVSLMFYRYVFFRIEPRDLAPPYWISMGAMAISTLAGSLLVASAPDAPFLASLAPFIKGFTVFYWATGTWWIPLLVVLLAWRHGYGGVPMRYEPLYWSAVFPLGMYAAGTFQMAHALDLAFLFPVLPFLGYIALAAWSVAFVGLVRALLRGLLASRGQSST
jgi:tellurite resistance protein TehA-like permease